MSTSDTSRGEKSSSLVSIVRVLNTPRSNSNENPAIKLAEQVKDELVSKVNQNMSDLMSIIQREQDRISAQTKSLREALEKAQVRDEAHQHELDSLRQEKRDIILENAAERDERLDAAQIENEDKLDQLRSVMSDLVVGKRELKVQLEQERATVTQLKLDIIALDKDNNGIRYALCEAEDETQVAYDKVDQLQRSLRKAEAESASAGELKHDNDQLRILAKRNAKLSADKLLDLEQKLAATEHEKANLRTQCKDLQTKITMASTANANLELKIKAVQQEIRISPQLAAPVPGYPDLRDVPEEQRIQRKKDEKVSVSSWQDFATSASTRARVRHDSPLPFTNLR